MCGNYEDDFIDKEKSRKKIPLSNAIGLTLAHDITEIRPGEFKCRAYRKGHVIKEDDIGHLRRLGKEQIFVLDINPDEMHEDDAALMLAAALMGNGTAMQGAPSEGKVNILAARDGLLNINEEALLQFNLLGEIMCATLHNNTLVTEGTVIAGTRAVPLVVKKAVVNDAISITERFGKVVSVKCLRRPKAGIVITGNEVFSGRITDAFESVIRNKIDECDGEVVGLCFAPDDEIIITDRLRGFVENGADLLITTGGMSVDPDDVTRFAIRNLGATDISYGSAALPGAMLLVAYIPPGKHNKESVPVLGIPACGIHHKTTVFDLILPRILSGERIGRRELANLGHGGLCMNCPECRYPQCPFGKG